MFTKRQSLRERERRRRRNSVKRPSSDSNVSYVNLNEHATNSSEGLSFEYPEMPADVPDWIERRSQARRDPPALVQDFLHQDGHWSAVQAHEDTQSMYELDASPLLAAVSTSDEAQRAGSPNP
jgi:hypothetical protein